MKLLLACEFYHPSRGGVQEVMRQIAERLVEQGHDVTVATTRLADRDFSVLNGVKIIEFDLSGNRVNGIAGDVKKYHDFLKEFDCDALMIKAAQQWTFDATWPVIDDLSCRKVFIPCGFSGLFLPEYDQYFRELPAILQKWDHLIFYAEQYRDIDFARKHGLSRFSILPNAASEVEFAVEPDPEFRTRHGIGQDDFVIITVGTPINAKGHTELAAAFSLLEPKKRNYTLILNGQWPRLPDASAGRKGEIVEGEHEKVLPSLGSKVQRIAQRAAQTWKAGGVRAFSRRLLDWLFYRSRQIGVRLWAPLEKVGSADWKPLKQSEISASTVTIPKTISDYIFDIEAQPSKKVLCTNLARPELVQTFLNADLFVFASNIEYSPLVLFEAAAAGLPFVTVPVGNADEIVKWTGGGIVCPAEKDRFGYTRVEPEVLAKYIDKLIDDSELRQKLAQQGRESWRSTYNWASIAPRYARILSGE
jgi:glycosyltransferase involved in cell wall biosynthesis